MPGREPMTCAATHVTLDARPQQAGRFVFVAASVALKIGEDSAMKPQVVSASSESAARGPVRLYYLDWLRVLAILTVFVYHSTRFFNMEDWHVKNPTWYPWVEVWNVFAGTWMMPLIFLISGASLFYAVGKGGAGKFVKDKTLRLLVPLLVGVFTHASLQVYLERVTHGQFSGTYFQFLPQYFNGFIRRRQPGQRQLRPDGHASLVSVVAVSLQHPALPALALAEEWRLAGALPVGRWVGAARRDLLVGASGSAVADAR
jgi:hypothetical protein